MSRLTSTQVSRALTSFIVVFSAWYIRDAVMLPSMPIMSGYALSIGLGESQISFLAGVMSLVSAGALVGVVLIRRVRHRRSFIVILGGCVTLCLMPAMVLVSSGISPQYRFGALCAFAACLYLVYGTLNACVYSWQAGIVPNEIAGSYMSKRTLIPTFVSVVFLFLAGRWLDAFSNDGVLAFLALFLLCSVVTACGFFVLGRTPYPQISTNDAASSPQRWFDPLTDKPYRRLLVFLVCSTVPQRMAAAFFSVYMIRHLGLSYTHTTAYVNLSYLAVAAGFLMGGHACQRFGSRPIIQMSTCLYVLVPVIWFFAGPGCYRLLLPLAYILSGLSLSASFVCVQTLLIKTLSKDRDNSHYFALWTASIAGAGALGPFLGSLMKSLLPDQPVILGPVSVEPLSLVFGLAAVLSIFPIFLSTTLLEPGAVSPLFVIRQLRGNVIRYVRGVGSGRGEI